MKATASKTATRQITFEITTAVPLPTGEQIFVSGSTRLLGKWDPCTFPLDRKRDNVWSRTAEIPINQPIEYKITRGSWASEEVTPDANIPANKIIPAGIDDILIQHWVHHWKDLRMGLPPQITGNYDIHERVHSKHLENSRRVLVWLPPSYYKNPSTKYPVIYMHDGQQVFDPTTSTMNKAWDVDDWCTALTEEGRIQEVIVVAIYCTEFRASEYAPDEQGDDYIAFITQELMPIINRDYRTLTDAENTCIAGSSMGGLISFYAAWKHPDIFAKAACLSPALSFNGSSTCLHLVKKAKKKPMVKFFLYCGNGDALETELMTGTLAMAKLLKSKKFSDGADLLLITDQAAEHNEAAWNKHTGEWLEFLFGC